MGTAPEFVPWDSVPVERVHELLGKPVYAEGMVSSHEYGRLNGRLRSVAYMEDGSVVLTVTRYNARRKRDEPAQIRVGAGQTVSDMSS